MSELPKFHFDSQAAWEAWLDENHDSATGLWLKIAKKASDVTSVSYAEALDVGLCYGWIDGQRKKLDDDFYLQRYTPRRKTSKWSRINRDKVTELIAQGRMQPSGLVEIEKAKADGRWEQAYESQSNITIPDDFQAALDKNPDAQAFFDQLNKTNRYAFLYRLATVKKEATRQRNIEKFIMMLNANEKFH